MSDDRVKVEGSDRAPVPGARELGPVAADEVIQVTLVLRRRAEFDEGVNGTGDLSPDELGRRFGAAPADVEVVTTVVTAAGATVVDVDAPSRRVRVEGSHEVLSDQNCARSLV